jgi:5'(3')-deoxyribonucleotidase
MKQFFSSKHFTTLQPIPHAFESLLKLKCIFDLHIVTARQNSVEHQTRAWLQHFFPNIFTEVHFGNHYSTVVKSRTKAEICKEINAVLLVDDSLSHAVNCSSEGVPVILFGN